jgi:hypothetical protein
LCHALVWPTVDKCTLKDNRSLYEHRVLVRLAELLPADVKVNVLSPSEASVTRSFTRC